MKPILKPCDICLIRDDGVRNRTLRLVGKLRSSEQALVNIVSLVISEGDISSARIIEAVSRFKVKIHTLSATYLSKRFSVAIYRAPNLLPDELERIVQISYSYAASGYSYIPHRLFENRSELVLNAFAESSMAIKLDNKSATPTAIYNYIQKNLDEFIELHPLKPITLKEY
jgi:hypothetical protein